MSKTPAQIAGLVLGKSYKVTSARCDHFSGGIYKFVEDDGTNLPYFELVEDVEGKGLDQRVCVWVNGLGGTTLVEVEVPAETPVEPAAAHVSLNGNSTTIVVQRNLSADEVAAVLKAINAA